MAATKTKTGPGHPGKPPRKTITIRLDEDLLVWLYENVPRPRSISDYINEAVNKQVHRDRAREKS